MDSCPREPNIPIFMIVGGFFGALTVTSRVVRGCLNRLGEMHDEDIYVNQANPYESIINLFLFAYYIAGMKCDLICSNVCQSRPEGNIQARTQTFGWGGGKILKSWTKI